MNKSLLLIGMLFMAGQSYAQTGTVTIEVSGINADKGGLLSAGIFTEPNFPQEGKQLDGTFVEVNGANMTITFNNIPVGEYGLVAYHDLDKNRKLNTNFVGFPTEPVAFSRDAKINFGPPSFKDAKVEVKDGETLIVPIKLR